MAYLNLDLDYFDHPKTKRLVGLLGRGSDVLPVRLWCYCGKYHAETGTMTGYSPTDLESLIGWWGQPGKAVDALVRLGFLETAGAGFQVHDWDKINGHIAAFKARAQAGAKAKWAKAKADAQAMLKHSLSNAVSNALQEESKESKDSSLPGGDPRGGGYVRNTLAAVDPGNLMPAPPDPPNLPATAAALKTVSAKEEFWQPLCRIFGLEPKTMDDELRLYDQCAAFRQKGATVAEIERRKVHYHLWFTGAACTPKAMLSNWDVCKVAPAANPKAPERPRKTLPRITA